MAEPYSRVRAQLKQAQPVSDYAYVTDDGRLAMFPLWSVIGEQLTGFQQVEGLVLASQLVRPRYQIFQAATTGQRMNIIIPQTNIKVWTEQSTFLWNSIVYTAVQWYGEKPIIYQRGKAL